MSTTTDAPPLRRSVAQTPTSPRPVVRPRLLPTLVLAAGALYCVLPVAWVVVAATKAPGELFTTSTLVPSLTGGFGENLRGLMAYEDGRFLRWALNSLVYAGGGALASTLVSAAAGYALAVYRFRGRAALFNLLLAGVLVPQVTLALPQYLLLAQVGLADTMWAVLLPSIISPFGIYLARIYAAASVSPSMLEAGRLDGAGEWRLFRTLALPTMLPGLVTVFLLQFVAVWNNFLLPYVMLTDPDRFPLTVGLFTMLNQGLTQPALYTLVIMGVLLSTIPLVALVLSLQRFWRMDLVSGGVKS
jgi:multiple sugar transport system permease protein